VQRFAGTLPNPLLNYSKTICLSLFPPTHVNLEVIMQNHVGIAGIGTYLPSTYMTAKDISDKTNGVWSEQAIVDKLGIIKKTIPGKGDGAQAMGVFAANAALKNANMDAREIDIILCITEE